MNYLNHEKTYGYWDEIDWESIIFSSEFCAKQEIGNDKIEVCKLCKYRYMCISRSDLICKQGKWHKVNYCNYNP